MKKLIQALSGGPLGFLLCWAWNGLFWIRFQFLKAGCILKGARLPSKAQQEYMRQNVTIIFKSFQRQRLAKKLYRNIQRYYPGVRVIIADDSKQPLRLEGPGLQVIQLPYDVGLSAGLNQALARVETPYVIRMDDDELLTPCSGFHRQLEFLENHPEADLVGVLPVGLMSKKGWRENTVRSFARFTMENAPKALKIPHWTWLDETHVVCGKVPNIFIARTEPYRALGYDDNIRMIDHHEFFFRAAGNLVSVLSTECFVAHNHCPFDHEYRLHRSNFAGDRAYIAAKHGMASSKKAE